MAVGGKRVSPVVVLTGVLVVGLAQLLVLPVANVEMTIQAVAESVFLAVVVVGLFVIPSSNALTELSGDETETVYLPVLLGLGLFAVRAVTDLLDEFLVHPDILLTLLEDVAMTGGTLFLLFGINRWTRLRLEHERLLREQRNQLDRQNERLESFADVVSHDLRSPLNVAQGTLNLAREDGDRDDHEFSTAHRALHRMEEIIDDVLELARLGPDALHPTSVTVTDVVEDAWRSVDTERAELRLDVPTDTVVTADRRYLQRAFENVFRNAVEHGGPTVTVRVAVTDTAILVEDDGVGIPPDRRSQIFETGYSGADDGTGFGLSIVEEIAELHGWRVTVTEGVDGGARFEFVGVDVRQ